MAERRAWSRKTRLGVAGVVVGALLVGYGVVQLIAEGVDGPPSREQVPMCPAFGRTSSTTTPGGPKQEALAAALRRAPDVARLLREGDARLLEISGWDSLGFAANYQLDEPVDLPTRFGTPHVLRDGPEGNDDIETDEDGLPVMVPLEHPYDWNSALVEVFVATVGPDAPTVHIVRPGVELPCPPEPRPGMPTPPPRPGG